MSPSDLTVDLTTSFARRVDGEVHITVGVPYRPAEAGTTLRLTSGARVVTAPLTTGRIPGTLEARLVRGQLSAGLWRLAVMTEKGDTLDLEARLVLNQKQPVALLAGPRPKTRMPAPSPASRVASADASRNVKIRRTAVSAVDAALSVLPERPRQRTRAALAGVARRLLR